MAYEKVGFIDRSVEFPNRYKDENNVQHTFTKDPGDVYAEGTPLNRVSLDQIEEGIVASRQTYVTDRGPTEADNASVGVAPGDRWLNPLRQTVVNLIPEDWTDMTKYSATYNWTWTSGFYSPGIKYVQAVGSLAASAGGAGDYKTRVIQTTPPPVGHKLFVGCAIRLTTFTYTAGSYPSIDGSIGVDFTGTGGSSINNPLRTNTVGSLKSIGMVVTVPSTAKQLGYTFSSSGGSEVGTTSWNVGFEAPMIIDLTEAFGTGNEPTAAQCLDMFLSPTTLLISADTERYFTNKVLKAPKAYVCTQSNETTAEWVELFSINSTPQDFGQVAAGFTPIFSRYYTVGPFVYFEVKLTVTVATTAGQIKAALVALPIPACSQSFDVTYRNAAGALVNSIVTARIIGEDDTTLSQGTLYLNTPAIAAVNTTMAISGCYRVSN